MLAAVLESYRNIQKEGLKFDWMHDGKLYKDTEFILFIPHIKADNEEAVEGGGEIQELFKPIVSSYLYSEGLCGQCGLLSAVSLHQQGEIAKKSKD
jgi:hypothetical protein